MRKPESNSDRHPRMARARVAFAGVLLVGLFFGASPPVRADDSDENEYNFKWLDPDKRVYVLQNRKFEKSGRLLLSGMVGIGMSNPYRNTYVVEPRVAYYLTETVGIEAF